MVVKVHQGVTPFIDGPVLLYYDSSSAIAQAKESKSHHRTKHVLHRYHLVREIVNHGDVELQKIDRKENLADPDDFKWKMGIKYCPD